MKILMVCLGNICRSPIAEGVMRSKFIKYNFDGSVDSAGLINFHEGEHPDSRAVAVAAKYDVDISQQLARQFNHVDFKKFDLILAMDQPVFSELIEMTADDQLKNKVKLFMEFSGNSSVKNVPDPYYGSLEGFEKVFAMIDESCEKICRKIQTKE